MSSKVKVKLMQYGIPTRDLKTLGYEYYNHGYKSYFLDIDENQYGESICLLVSGSSINVLGWNWKTHAMLEQIEKQLKAGDIDERGFIEFKMSRDTSECIIGKEWDETLDNLISGKIPMSERKQVKEKLSNYPIWFLKEKEFCEKLLSKVADLKPTYHECTLNIG